MVDGGGRWTVVGGGGGGLNLAYFYPINYENPCLFFLETFQELLLLLLLLLLVGKTQHLKGGGLRMLNFHLSFNIYLPKKKIDRSPLHWSGL